MLWSAFLLGIVSSLHCVGMCAPLQIAALGAFQRKAKPSNLLLYHLSRIATYALLGTLVGVLGKGLGLQQWQQQASLLSGLFLLAAFTAFYLLKLDRKLLRLLYPLLSRIRGNLQRNRNAAFLYYGGSGVLNGLLPCGMVYLALFPATAAGNVALSAFYMALFGLGTLPLLALTNLGGLRFLQAKSKWVRHAIPVMVVGTALLLILRGMDLGIPYLSPKTPKPGAQVEACK